MNDKIKWLIISVLLVGLIAGATVLYNSLGEQNGGGGLIIDMPSQNTEDSSENATDAIGTQATDTTESASDLPTTAPEESTSNTADVTTEKPEEPEEPENPAPDFTMVDMNGKEVKLSELRGKPVDVPPKELELLYFLASNYNRVFTRDQLLDKVWGFDYLGDSRTVDVHVKRLREKLEGVSDKWILKTVWGVGYKFEILS